MTKLREEFVIKTKYINMKLWIEDGKVAQSGQPGYPKYLAEFPGNYQARDYILGMVRMAELIRMEERKCT